MQVSCFGPDGNGDDADNWILETEGNAPYWSRFKPVRSQDSQLIITIPLMTVSSIRQVYFKHEVTGSYLHSHDVKYRQPIAGQQEITAVPARNSNCKWITEVCIIKSCSCMLRSSRTDELSDQEGIFFPEREVTKDNN